jgi:hypothetical protein
MTAEEHELPLFPLNTVLFPGMALPLHIFEDDDAVDVVRCGPGRDRVVSFGGADPLDRIGPGCEELVVAIE